MKTLVLAEHNNQELNASIYHVITAAKQLSEHVTVIVIGHQCEQVAEQAAKIQGVSEVSLITHENFQHQLPENISLVLKAMASGYDYLLAPANTAGKNILPRVAALLDVGQLSEITAIIDHETFLRPIYAGNAIAKVKSHDNIKVITVRTTAFAKAPLSEKTANIETLDKVVPCEKVTFIKHELSASERPSLASARVVISGGRGLQSAENFKLLDALADKLGAAIGASRAAVDAGFAPNDFQVGQTGKVVAPELYIAIGISGAIQHLAGMKDSKVIVAINKDPDAPIFKIADYGLVGDLFEIIRELERLL